MAKQRLQATLDSLAQGGDLGISTLFRVEGKTALVSGGSIGIGRMIAGGLVANGCRVFICSRKAAACEKAAEELTSKGPGVAVPLPGDLSTEEGAKAVAAALRERLGADGALHILINNAGATWGGRFEEYPDHAWDRIFHLNVRGVFQLTQQTLPQLRAGSRVGDPARVINISSVAGHHVETIDAPTTAYAYAASKAAVNHMTKTLAHTIAGEGEGGITVNAIAPGLFPSKMTQHVIGNDQAMDYVRQANPLHRFGTAEDAAGLTLFLCSRAGGWINGAVIPVDGGQFA